MVKLKERLSEAFGQGVCSLRRIRRGSQSVNYAGVREDGFRFLLKLVPLSRERQYRQIVDHLESVVAGPVVRELSPRIRFDVPGFHALLLEWCAGAVLPFDQLLNQVDAGQFLQDYQDFATSIQSVHDTYAPFNYAMMLATVRDSPFGAEVDEELTATDFAVLAPQVIIHGDFQSDNLRFRAGRLVSVLDIEEFRPGSPVEDLARYVCCSAGHVPWYRPDRRRKTLANLAQLVKATPYSAEEWIAALRGQFLKRLYRLARHGGGMGLINRVDLRRHLGACRAFVKVVKETK